MSQALTALEYANVGKAEIHEWKQALVDGEATLAELLRDVPPSFGNWSLLEVMRLGRGWGRIRAAEINEWAIKAGLNLATPWNRADPRAVAFCVLAAEKFGKGRGWAERFGE